MVAMSDFPHCVCVGGGGMTAWGGDSWQRRIEVSNANHVLFLGCKISRFTTFNKVMAQSPPGHLEDVNESCHEAIMRLTPCMHGQSRGSHQSRSHEKP